jgi:hypothetical protein
MAALDFDPEEMLPDELPAADIDALGLTRERLQDAYQMGELSHLTVTEIGELLASANNRDMQKTILR